MRFGIFGVVVGVVALFLVGTLWGCFYTVDQRERAVVLRNGAVVGEADPGLHFKLPVIENFVRVSVEEHRVNFEGMEAYSRDRQPAILRVSVLYAVVPSRVTEVYARFTGSPGLEDRVIRPKVLEQTKNVFGQFDAVTAVQDRARLNAAVATAIHDAIDGMNAPLTLRAVQIENIAFSPDYIKSVEAQVQAAVEVERLKQNALREQVQAQIAVTQATGRADALRAEARARADATVAQATAEAQATRLRGEAEATAIKARGEALGANPNLVTLTQAERWDGKLPTTMVPGAAVPMLTVR